MVVKDPKLPLKDIKKNYEEIKKRIVSLTFEEFENDFDKNRVIKYCFLEMCEAFNQLKKIYHIENDKINEYIYLANRLKHNYWVSRDRILFLELNSKEFEKTINEIEKKINE